MYFTFHFKEFHSPASPVIPVLEKEVRLFLDFYTIVQLRIMFARSI